LDIKRMFVKFIGHFDCPITHISKVDIDSWLHEPDASGPTQDNQRAAIHNFFGCTQSTGYLPKKCSPF
jgi:hypothetical protein